MRIKMIGNSLIFLLILNIVQLSIEHADDVNPLVYTNSGRIRGFYKKSYLGRNIQAFESIPYAEPPVGNLRFEPPVPISPWSNILNATSAPVACKQYDMVFYNQLGKEDCLYLNIYVPETKKSSFLPVIFWIPGGGFQYGTSSNYGPKYLMDRDVILVTLNYRLSAFGFLSTGDNVVPGNMGLKDQNLALRWINDNVHYFGGDSKKITLAGVSAGGASVHYHYLSPMSRGLFNNGISFSGTAVNSFAHTDDSKNVTKTLAKLVGCSIEDSYTMVQCLKKISDDRIIKATQEMIAGIYFSFVLFPPITERIETDYFINSSPIEIIERGDVYDVPWISTIVQDDGLFMVAAFALDEEKIKDFDERWTNLAPYALHYKYTVPENRHIEIAEAAKYRYFGNDKFSNNKNGVKNLSRLIGDALIVIGAVRAAKLQAKVNKSPVWFYHYTYRAAQSLTDYMTNTTIDFGVCHDDDIYLILENKHVDPTTTIEDRAMLEEMLNFWYSFADAGKPNLGTYWASIEADFGDFQFLNIAGPKDYRMEVDNNFRDIDFWTSIGL